MFLEIITVKEKLFSEDIKLIQVPGSKGSFEVLNNHAPIISTLTKGNIKVLNTEGKESAYEINSGIIEVINNKIIVLAEMV